MVRDPLAGGSLTGQEASVPRLDTSAQDVAAVSLQHESPKTEDKASWSTPCDLPSEVAPRHVLLMCMLPFLRADAPVQPACQGRGLRFPLQRDSQRLCAHPGKLAL